MIVNEVKYIQPGFKFPQLKGRIDSGLIAFGGDLSISRLLEAYSKGIFPWYDVSTPILWHSPMERCIFNISDFIPSRSLKQKLKKGLFRFTFDQEYKTVMLSCALIERKGEKGTWITREMVNAYTNLHKAGFAHSLEVWHQNKLVGGLFGVSLGKAFFGESMFHRITDASKAGMFFLFEFLQKHGFHFVDAQMETNHLLSLGAKLIPRDEYLDLLTEALKFETIRGNWNDYIQRDGTAPNLYGRSD